MDTSVAQQVLPQDSPAIRLLEDNDAGRGVYISHLDRTPVSIKMKTFAIPVVLHMLLAVIMIWRASKNTRVIFALILNDFHYIEPRELLIENGFWSWCWTFMVAILDYRLIKGFGQVIYDFIVGHLWLRLRYGFHETEVVFRTPKSGEAWQPSLLRAASHQFVESNTGYNTCSPPWEYCYAASTDAYRLENEGVFDLKNWELGVWHRNEHRQWTVLRVQPSVRTGDIILEKLQERGKEAFVAKLEVIRQEIVEAAPDTKAIDPEGIFKSFEIPFREEGLDLRELCAEAEAEEERNLNQPLFQLYFP